MNFFIDSSGSMDSHADCPMCAAGKPATEQVMFSAVVNDRVVRMAMGSALHQRLSNVALTLKLQANQHAKACGFRRSKMIYQGARHGTR